MFHAPDLNAAADRFMAYDYAETKDLCKQFLTLVSGVLVFSVTFAEKIVGYADRGAASRWPIVLSWTAFIAAMILGGCALGAIGYAGGAATNGSPETIYKSFEMLAAHLAILGGCCFILGMILLVAAGIATLFRRRTAPPA